MFFPIRDFITVRPGRVKGLEKIAVLLRVSNVWKKSTYFCFSYILSLTCLLPFCLVSEKTGGKGKKFFVFWAFTYFLSWNFLGAKWAEFLAKKESCTLNPLQPIMLGCHLGFLFEKEFENFHMKQWNWKFCLAIDVSEPPCQVSVMFFPWYRNLLLSHW